MEEMLTYKQRVLLRIAEEYGFITLAAAHRVYNTPKAAANAVRKLVDFKLIRQTKIHGKFELVGGKQ